MSKTLVTKSRRLQEKLKLVSNEAYENFKNIVDDIEINGFIGSFADSEDLREVFYWSDSPQGADYWCNVYTSLDRVINKKGREVFTKKKKEYVILHNNTPEDLAILINEQMCDYDVEFVGGVTVTYVNDSYNLYAQALLRSERE